jgi:hypothetical protein
MRSWHLPVKKTKKLGSFSNPAFEKKRKDRSPLKMSLLIGHVFSREGNNKPYRKIYMKKEVLLIYRMILKMLGIGG